MPLTMVSSKVFGLYKMAICKSTMVLILLDLNLGPLLLNFVKKQIPIWMRKVHYN